MGILLLVDSKWNDSYMLHCKCETGGFANTLNSWWIHEYTGANAKPYYLKSYG